MIGPGDALGRYRIEAVLGRGAMGEVYRAVDPAIGRAVAIKTVRLDAAVLDAADDDLFERFRREARSAGRLKHPNIVSIYDYGEDDGLYFLVMELVEGTTLADRIAAAGALPTAEACSIGVQACSALGVAHARGVVHRDIKPANLMIEAETGLVKVLDFGVARLDASELTRTGVVFGTPAYMAPEQILGRQVDHRSDLFSLGAVLYEALTGRKAFPGEHLATVTYRIVNDGPDGFDEIPARLGEGTAAVMARALAKDPGERFQSAGEFAEAIQTHALGAVAAPASWGGGLAGPGFPTAGPGTPPGGWSPAPSGAWGGYAGTPPGGWIPAGTPAGGVPAPARPRRTPLLLGGGLALAVAAGVGAWTIFGGSGRPSRSSGGAIPVAETAPPPVVAAPTEEALLVVAVEPSGAAVTVDDSLAPAPGDTLALAAGPHRVGASMDGRSPADTTVTLVAGETATLDLVLAEEEPPGPTTGTLTVTANVPGRVFAGGRSLGAAPRRGLTVAAGRHRLRFVPDGAEPLAVERTVDVPAGGAASVAFDVVEGLLSVLVREPRWARVYVDGSSLGDTPVVGHRVRAGVHRVRLEREGYRPAERTLTVEPAGHARWVDVRLDAAGGSP